MACAMITTGIKLQKVTGIYSFIHRESGICYVGSSVNLGARRSAHMSAARNGASGRLYSAIREHGEAAFDFEVLEECKKSELLLRENFYISLLGASSINGLNVMHTPFARYGFSHSEETKKRIGLKNLGKKRPLEFCLQVSLRLKGKKLNPRSAEHAAAISNALKGRKATEEAKRNMALGQTGRKHSEETKQKISSANTGKRKTKEHCEKMRQNQFGKKHSEQSKLKMSIARTGSKLSESHCLAISKGLTGKKRK